jgi:hypothetical protein
VQQVISDETNIPQNEPRDPPETVGGPRRHAGGSNSLFHRRAARNLLRLSVLVVEPHNNMRAIMPTARYFIVRNRDQWSIRYGDQEFGPYKSQDEATLFAIDAARKLGKYGGSAEVCLMGENGHFRSEWTLGRDHHPPSP